MASFDTPLASTAGARFGSRLNALVSGIRTWNDTRITRNALSRLSDHELEDIGLTRADIAQVTHRR